MNPQYTSESLANLYRDKDSAEMIPLYSQIASPSVVQGYQRTLDLLEQHVPEKGRLLDFACAAGYFMEEAGKRGWEAHGVDIGEWTKEAAAARGVSNLHVGTLHDLNFPDHFFDVVYAAQVFEHLPEPKADLAEIRRILRPGGLLYVDVPNYRTLSIVFGRDDFFLNDPPQHINYFSPSTLRALLNNSGYRPVRMISGGGLKWENLFGREVKSDIADAYRGRARTTESPAPAAASAPQRKVRHKLKGLVVSTVIKPIFYNWLKVGMLLVALARRP
jgi:SAM-dependent methyltransferase